MDMPLNSSRLPLDPDHIATQMREQQHIADESTPSPPIPHENCRPLRRSARAAGRPSFITRTPTPPPIRGFERRGAVFELEPYIPADTRRHGMILENTRRNGVVLSNPEESSTLQADALPPYTDVPCNPFRRMTDDGRLESELVDTDLIRDRQSRQMELRELQRQWNVRRRTHPVCPTERTQYRALVSEAYDLPPPYASRDPYPLFKPEERKPSIWSRVVLYPFVPEGEMLNKAAFATDRLASKVAFGVKKGVEEVGKKAKAVPRQIECKRAKRKIKWLEGRGYIDVDQEREVVDERAPHACGVYHSAFHFV